MLYLLIVGVIKKKDKATNYFTRLKKLNLKNAIYTK